MDRELSKFISLILRHKPEVIHITLDEHGWADVEKLIEGINKCGKRIDLQVLERIVKEDGKQRYSFNQDKTLIRANQGHSIAVDVELSEEIPPDVLYHGTAQRFLQKILTEGLKPMNRLYVHLSRDYETAVKVGSRHGKPVILKVDTNAMVQAGYKFYLSENNVWLTNKIEPEYIEVTEGKG